ncbi:SusC/RagA family TonB-linked outer membrane protein [Pedobacter soli]|uniref:TonB-linked outer membrane protein, SusC/RagA family n=1 Tax=Pedobacter soli TaxID=390242 RepID=A0A1G6WWY4_9SPHI|nr:SusC/RagA family TonB-linked outer membrane protein [Pedobacter soli]SDD70402.1 TonB-linked outer membrane protein, SusC/RagA family [Pedobacter soli]
MNYKIIIILLLLSFGTKVYGQHIFKAQIRGSKNAPLPGALVTDISNEKKVSTDEKGNFSLTSDSAAINIRIGYVGYKVKTLRLFSFDPKQVVINLEPLDNQLADITIISDGYQSLPKERSTGSFVQLDQSIINRRISANILSRIEDVTSGLVVNRNPAAGGNISIRGQSTLFSNRAPLIILDNFPYEGDLNAINPNDIESITVLKDAAAASIWGARAGNGVIVLNSKKGKSSEAKVGIFTSLTIGAKPDIYYLPRMSSSDYIDIEASLFNSGFYKDAETSLSNIAISPVVELLISKRDGKISQQDADRMIDQYRAIDVREDQRKYMQRTSVDQQYSLNISGGSGNSLHFISGGFDKNLNSDVGNSSNRITLNANQVNYFFKRKLELNTAISFLQAETNNNNQGLIAYSYARLVDGSEGYPNVTRGLRESFKNEMVKKGFLDWQYNPLADIDQNKNSLVNTEFRINTSLKYNIFPFLSASILYQFAKSSQDQSNLQRENSYYLRNLINQFTSINADGSLTRRVPIGGILDESIGNSISHNLRGQLAFDKSIGSDHNVSAIAGAEVRQMVTNSSQTRAYGYSEEYVRSSTVDYLTRFPLSFNTAQFENIPFSDGMNQLTDRFLSYYVNASYSYKQRYIFSASTRLDQSNLFGVDANKKGVPLYSAGLAWNIAREPFYNIGFLPLLKLRTTYGYSGNVFRSLSAYTTASYSNGTISSIKLPFAQIESPPNPSLRWEKIRMVNIAVDFATKGNRISGSIEYYSRKASDLLGTTPVATSTGISSFRGNTADTKGYGIDLTLNTQNIKGIVGWSTNLLFSVAMDKVTAYPAGNLNSAYISGGLLPVVGKPIGAISSYAWGGLDPSTGDPIGFLNGVPSKDYTKIISSSTLADLVYNGPARPPVYGSIRNNIDFGPWSFSANISYRFGYYFHRPSISYGTTKGLGGHSDYTLRWKNPGDESITSVPSVPLVANTARDEFYKYANVLTEHGDNIRLQDINFSYQLPADKTGKVFRRLQVSVYLNNLGIIWQESKSGIDPDFQSALLPKSIALGIRGDF